jgi:hypothetical protein
MVRDLTFSTEDSAKTWVASPRVGRVVSGSVAEVGEGEEDEMGALRLSVGVVGSAEVMGGGMSEWVGSDGCGS